MHNPFKRFKHKARLFSKKDFSGNLLRSIGLSFFFLLLFITQAQATHIVGGQLSYRCLGNNRYEITLLMYRDCKTANPEAVFDDPASVGIFDSRGNQLFQIGKNGSSGEILMDPIGNDTIPFNANICEPLPDTVCVHTTLYRDTLILPFRAGGYILSYQRCCRNTDLTNIVEPLKTGSNYWVAISESALTTCNASPSFKSWPPVYVCNYKQWVFDHSATDADGDQLVYRLNTPYSGAGATFDLPKPQGSQLQKPTYEGDTVTWKSVFSRDDMLGNPTDAVKINPSTGRITGTPTAPGRYLIGICVDEYRNGVLIGTVCRDFEINIIDCGDKPTANFSAPDLQCDNRTVTFTNESIDADEFIWYWNWPNPTPSQMDANLPPSSISYTFPDTGTFVIGLIAINDTTCRDTFLKEIIIRDSGLDVDFDLEKLLCGDSVNFVLTDKTRDTLSPAVNWLWELRYDNVLETSAERNPRFSVPYLKTGTIRLTVTAANGCSLFKEINFEANSDKGLIPDFNYTIVQCKDEFTVYVKDNSRDDVGQIIRWEYTVESNSIPNATQSGPDTVFGKFIGDQLVKITLEIESDSGCVSKITKTFNLIPPDINLTPDFTITPVECDTSLVLDFMDNSYQGPAFAKPVAWSWTIEYPGGVLTSSDQNFTGVSFDTTVTVKITLCVTYEDENGEIICEDNCITRELTLNFIGADFFDTELDLCARKAIQINPNNPIPNLIWNWSPDPTLNPCCNNPSPWASPLETTTYTVTITDPVTGCIVIKEVTVTVVDPDGPAAFEFDNICGKLDFTVTKTSGGPVVRWDFGDGNSSTEDPEARHTYAAAGDYIITLYTGGDCPDTIALPVSVKFVDVMLPDTLSTCDEETLELNPNGNPSWGYRWEPADKIVGSNTVFNPTVRITEPTTFRVTITEPQCDSIVDSIHVVLPDPIVLNTESTLELCKDTTVLFVATSPNAVKFTWKDADTGEILGEGDSLSIYLTVDRNIKVCVEDKYGCILESQVNVRFFAVVFTLDGDNPMCVGDTVNLCVSSPQESRVVSWMWTPLDQIIGPATNKCIRIGPPSTTTYNIKITYDDGCVVMGDYTLVVSDFDTPVVCDVSKDTILQNETVDLTVAFDPSYTYQWEPAELVEDPTAASTKSKPLTEDVQFCVTVTNKDGCTRECCVNEVLVLDITCEESIYLPNAFSPKGDGANDVLFFRIFSGFEDTQIELIIYNRFGEQVFRTTDPSIGWDGTYKGKLQPLGSYGYYLLVRCPDGKEAKKQGNISIIR